ncbi:capsular biosynthesis protein [Marinomonas piezotolerans]|uniref:Capsular biosynthesis protein n=1 Tax=Marinomonas piezotolerans TaxID=2213058 RepID=A0A370U8C7_9GAMM|nr:NAD-dependent epimerase/dehydratase family protein [Marinomonas piezotolerans]RDL44050.1 capsular biosynthesis protein [Marinomonas piezotolerans]
MRVLVTGTNGFIGKNLLAHLTERKDIEVVCFTREHSESELPAMLDGVQFVFHLAGVNRPQDTAEFVKGNVSLSQQLAEAIRATDCKAPVIYTSSIQAELDNPYGLSKRAAEDVLLALRDEGVPVSVFRLPNVFGKWAKPNYNSVVATFCHNIVNDLPIQINDPDAAVNLVYVDDVIEHFLALLDVNRVGKGFETVRSVYQITVGQLAEQLYRFRDSRQSLITERVGNGLVRALYSTYLSYVPKERFTYEVPKYGDPRGVFVEMLKTPDAGQFSYFTALPGITRGGHYHHTKTEKFLVIKGRACFKFRHIDTGEFYQLETNGEEPEIVETMPGWAHDITNIGDNEMIVMLWANEVFDREKPDTYACPLTSASQ